MMRIFIFNNASRAANYGIGTYLRQLSEGLSGCFDTVVSFIDMCSNVKEFTIVTDAQGYNHFQLPDSPVGWENETYCRCLFYLIARHIHVDTADKLVFQFNYFHHVALATLLKGYFPDCRIVLTVHYLNWCFELMGNTERLRKIIDKGYEPADDKERCIAASFVNEARFLHLADEVFVLSQNTRSILITDYKVDPTKLHLIYNGAGDTLSPRPFETFASRHILFMGRLDKIKGVKYLIAAFKKIASKYIDIRLTIAGDGNFQPYLEQSRSMQGRISFLGKVQGNEVEEVYRTAYIGVIPSFHEQCSYTAIEMMRHGIPFIGTDSTGLAEMLDATPQLRIHIDGENFNEEDFISQIVDRLDMLLSNNLTYFESSCAVCRLYNERYKISFMTEGIQTAIYQSFNRQSYMLSSDYLPYIDNRMKQLVEQSPDIDNGFFGLSGILIYLWWRFCSLQKLTGEKKCTVSLRTTLEQCMEWIQQVMDVTQLPIEMLTTLIDMKKKEFCPFVVGSLLEGYNIKDERTILFSDKQIMFNAIKICNCKI